MSGMNERDKAYVPWRAWDKISPGEGDEHTALVVLSEEGSFVRTQDIYLQRGKRRDVYKRRLCRW